MSKRVRRHEFVAVEGPDSLEQVELVGRVRVHHLGVVRRDREAGRDNGERIPMISRIICVADAYNAMTSDRPYRDAMQPKVARERLVQAAETQFDVDVVKPFDSILSSASDNYSRGARADFALEAQAHPDLALPAQASAL